MAVMVQPFLDTFFPKSFSRRFALHQEDAYFEAMIAIGVIGPVQIRMETEGSEAHDASV